MGNLYGSRISHHGNILLRINGGRRGGAERRGRDRKPNYVGGKGRGRNRKPNFVTCSTPIVSGWAVVAWGTESYSGLAGNTCFVYLALTTSALGMGPTVRLGKRNRLCCVSKIDIYFYFIFYFPLYHIWKISLECQVMVNSLGCCCWSGRKIPQIPDC